MNKGKPIKALVKESYTRIAESSPGSGCGCGGASGCGTDQSTISEDYTKLAGYNPQADLGLGCGVPTAAVSIRAGDVVVDLGSGAGNDVFVARALVGAKGRVIGIDMTEAMIQKARRNAEALKYENVEFRLGEIESLPIADSTADVVISNCVINLVPDKRQAFREIWRILKPGGRFGISDVVLTRELPPSAKTSAELYAGCIAGALLKDEYLAIVKAAGFKNVKVAAQKPLHVPEELLLKYVSPAELSGLDKSSPPALSITVYGEKEMKTLKIYDPAMCCSSGVCGPSPDTKLMKLAEDIAFLKSQGIEVERFNLGHQARAFTDNPLVLSEMGAQAEHLPIFVVDGEVKAKGRYPDRRELAGWFGLEAGVNQDRPRGGLNVAKKGGCCC